MQLPESWEEITLEEQRALEAELKRELTPGHPLHNVIVKAIARRNDCDDALFTIADSSSVAVVHLSYSTEINPLWPHTQFFGSFSQFSTHCVEN